MPKLLPQEEIDRALRELSGWKLDGDRKSVV